MKYHVVLTLAGPFMAVPPHQHYPRTHFASPKLGHEYKSGYQSFPSHSALEDVRQGS